MARERQLSETTKAALQAAVGSDIVGALAPELFSGEAVGTSGHFSLVLAGGKSLNFGVDSISEISDDSREEYFQLQAALDSAPPIVRRWPNGPEVPWSTAVPVANAVVGMTLESVVVLTIGGGDGLPVEVGVRLSTTRGTGVVILAEHGGLPMSLSVSESEPGAWPHEV